MASQQQNPSNGSQWSNSPPPLPQQSIAPQRADPIVRTAAMVYLATAAAPVITVVLVAGFVLWFLRS
jgi:hypothetical protein